jgi:hypothetical protein
MWNDPGLPCVVEVEAAPRGDIEQVVGVRSLKARFSTWSLATKCFSCPFGAVKTARSGS